MTGEALPYRLVAIDLDGTLLDARKGVSRRNLEAIRALREAGVHVAIVSGRRYTGLAPLIEVLPDDVLVVANSGAIVQKTRRGPILRRRLLPLVVAREILRFSEESGIEPIVHDGPDAEGHILLREVARGLPTMSRYVNATHPPPTWVERLTLERDPVQIGFAGAVAPIRAFERALTGRLGDEPSFATARTEYANEDLALLDVLARDATKASALAFLAEHLNIPLAATMAIGDNWNDLDMLEHAGLGVVMDNAPEALRALPFERTSSNEAHGVAEAIARLVLGGSRLEESG